MNAKQKTVLGKRFIAQRQKELEKRLQALRAEELKNCLGACGGCSEEGDAAELEFQGSMQVRVTEMRNQEIRLLQQALRRIKDGTYGLCCLATSDECDGYVAKSRLETNPAATGCIHCQRLEEKVQLTLATQPA